MHAERAAVPAGESERMVARLHQVDAQTVSTQPLTGLPHGQTLGAWLPAAMQFAGAP